MAAIWGIIRKTKNTTQDNLENLFNKMGDSMSVFSFDRMNTISCNDGFFASGHQYYTKEAEFDVSPIRDTDSQTIFCSDCFLYNRDSLIRELNDNSLKNAGDSQIAFSAYKKWGYSFVTKIRGCFAFAIYEEKNASLHLFSDHFSRQYTVYNNNPDYVCFSTTFKPVLACLGDNIKINREFIATAFCELTPLNFFKESITPYEDVFQLDSAIHVTIDLNTGKEKRERYWDPTKKIKKLKLNSDDEYKEAFRKLFKELTSQMLRSNKETGIMLSSGLDSSSVASFAAPLLKAQGKKLFSYTSVPCTGFVNEDKNPIIMTDESPLVELQKEFHGNLIPHYIQGNDNSCISDIDYFQNIYDMPVKASVNNVNIINMIKAANKDNCSVILSGENGNATISYGYLTEYLSLNIRRLHFLRAYKELSYSCKLYKNSRIKFVKRWIKDVYLNNIKKPEEDHYLLREEDEKKYKLTHPALDNRRIFGSHYWLSERQKNRFLFCPDQFIQKGFHYTHMGLLYHFIQLDPSLTVEMVEFCLSLPLECFVHNGIERRLCRDYLKDLMPEAITDMHKGFGAQARDFIYRINRDFDKYKDQIYRNLDEPLLREYLDCNKIEPIIADIKKAAETHTLDKLQSIQMSLLASLGGFLRDHTPKK